MRKQWEGLAPVYRNATLLDALVQASSKACQGDTVVFSPGCSSFDMFHNYEERGNVFRQLVRELASEEVST